MIALLIIIWYYYYKYIFLGVGFFVDPASCILYVLFLLFSSYFAAAETAYTAVSKVRMRTLADKGNRRAKRVLWISERFDKTLTTILIGNNIVNISISSILTSISLELFGSAGVATATFVVTLLLLI